MKIHTLKRITTLGINTQDLIEYLKKAEVIIDNDAELEIMHVEGGIIDCRVIEHFKREVDKDLFNHRDDLPVNVRAIVLAFEKLDGEMDAYEACRQLEDKLNRLGYTFDWDLDGIPHNLRKIK